MSLRRLLAFFLAALILPMISGMARAEDKKFILKWYGQSFFHLTTPAGKQIVFDPHAIEELGRNSVEANIVVCSHLHSDHVQIEVVEDVKAARVFYGIEETKKGKFDWKAIDEKVGQIRVRTVGLYHDSEEGLTRGKTSAFIIEAEGLTFCHLGDVGHELTDKQIKAIGSVDVLMVPVGGVFTANGELAKKITDQIKPKLYVLPMHYKVPGVDSLLTPDEFLDGQKNVKTLTNTNTLEIPAEPKAESTYTVVVLGWEKDEKEKERDREKERAKEKEREKEKEKETPEKK